MSEQSMSKPAANTPKAAEEAQEATTQSTQYSGGDALLDAEAKKDQSAKEAVNQPASTNFAQTDEQG